MVHDGSVNGSSFHTDRLSPRAKCKTSAMSNAKTMMLKNKSRDTTAAAAVTSVSKITIGQDTKPTDKIRFVRIKDCKTFADTIPEPTKPDQYTTTEKLKKATKRIKYKTKKAVKAAEAKDKAAERAKMEIEASLLDETLDRVRQGLPEQFAAKVRGDMAKLRVLYAPHGR